MHRLFLLLLAAAVALAGPARAPAAEAAGLADLDQATQLQLGARSLGDLSRVIELCESALEKGLDEANAQFARQLLASVLYQRAEALADGAAQTPPGPRRQRLQQLAMEDLAKAVQQQPQFGEAYLLMAKLHALGGQREEALKAVGKAIELLEEDKTELAKALVLRAQLQEDPDKRLADYDRAVELDPGNADAWRQRALFLLDQGDAEKAAEAFQRLLEQDEDDLVALHGAAEALMQMEKYEEALRYINRAIAAAPRSPIGYISRARIHGLMDKKEEAVKDLEEALRYDPGNIGALLLRARLYDALGRRDKALEDIEQVLKLRPRLPQALLLRSMLSASEGKFSAAIADIQSLLKEDPNNTDWRLQLAAYYTADKRPRRAIAIYHEILNDDPDNWEALRGRADALLSIGKHAEAIRDYERALKIVPNDSGVLNNLAWVLATSPVDELRDGKRAIELATKACELTDYKQAHILSTLAAAYAETGDFETAIKWSSKAVELGEGDMKDQLRKELETYKRGEPFREMQQVEEPVLPE